jgi:hypothetical protein
VPRDDAGRSVVPGEPVLKSGRGGCSAPWTVACEHVEQSRLFLAIPLRMHAVIVLSLGGAMRRLIDRCAGIDVGQALLVVWSG